VSEHVGGSVTATSSGRRWIILAIGMPTVNCAPAGARHGRDEATARDIHEEG
jgi:hypothetical protein